MERVRNKGQPSSPEAQRAKMAALGLSDFQLAFYTRALPVLLQRLDLLPPEYVMTGVIDDKRGHGVYASGIRRNPAA